MEKVESQSPNSGKLSSAQLRKIKKPIIEKRRRERINDSLNQLKSLVLDAMKKDESRYSKMEKADILELTVHHLRAVHRQQSAMQADDRNLSQKYTAGFSTCANEVAQFLSSTDCLTPELRRRVLEHLSETLQKSVQRAPVAAAAAAAFPIVPPAVAAIAALPSGTPIVALPGTTEAGRAGGLSPLGLVTTASAVSTSSSSSVPVALPPGLLLVRPSQVSPASSVGSMSEFSASPSPSQSSPIYSPSAASLSSLSSSSPSSPSSIGAAIPLYVTPSTRYSPARPFHESISSGRSSTSPSLADDVPSGFDDAQLLRDSVITTNSVCSKIVSSCKSQARVGYGTNNMVSSSNTSMWRPW